MYAPFAMIFPEESGRQRLTFSLGARNPYGAPAGSYELFDIYPAMQESPLCDILLNVTSKDAEILATIFCQLNPQAQEIHLALSEIHLQQASAPALLAAVEAQFHLVRGQKWIDLLIERAGRMQSAFFDTLPEEETPTSGTRLLRDDALQMLMMHSDDKAQQEELIDALLQEMRLLMFAELEAHRARLGRNRRSDNIIQFPGRRVPDWQGAAWLDLEIGLGRLPEIWRRISVPDCLSLSQLQRVLQAAFGWQDRLGWRFVHPRGEYVSHGSVEPRWDEYNADTATLAELLTRKGATLEYEYGQHWQHAIRVVQRRRKARADERLICLDGAMAGPPEDCGGPEGFRQLQHVLLKKRRSRADKLLLAELAGYDPVRFDREGLNRLLAALAEELLAGG